jgi:hypothetical protein
VVLIIDVQRLGVVAVASCCCQHACQGCFVVDGVKVVVIVEVEILVCVEIVDHSIGFLEYRKGGRSCLAPVLRCVSLHVCNA